MMPRTHEVSSFEKYGDYPVCFCNGTVGVSVPLFNLVASGNCTLPVSLSYHTSGILFGRYDGRSAVEFSLDNNTGRRTANSMEAPCRGVSARCRACHVFLCFQQLNRRSATVYTGSMTPQCLTGLHILQTALARLRVSLPTRLRSNLKATTFRRCQYQVLAPCPSIRA